MSNTIVIIGSGLAGYNLSREIRKHDKDSRLVIISRDAADSYSKPMLSNALSGNKSAEQLVMKDRDSMAGELDAEILAHTRVERIDAEAQTVQLDNGEQLEWNDLVLAVGADPIRLPLEGDAADDVQSVNDLDDFAQFDRRLQGVRKLVVLGGGLIGCEFANDVLSRDIRPTVIDIGDWPLGRLLPEEAARWFEKRLSDAGITFRFGAAAQRVERADNGYRVSLDNGDTLEADLVLSAVGLRPRTALAQSAGLNVDRGIRTDSYLRTSHPHIYAMGDCAEVQGVNLPFVMPIMQQARALGATLAGEPTEVNYPAMPVSVKTPACPTAVCPPPSGKQGQWKIVHNDDEGLEAHFLDEQDQLIGFVLMGAAVKRRRALAPEVPGPLAQKDSDLRASA